MALKNLLTVPRYGIYLPKQKLTTDVEYTPYVNGFKMSTSLQLGHTDTFKNVETTLKKYLKESEAYFAANDLELVGVLLGGAAQGASNLIKFKADGISLFSLIKINAKHISLIYEKYSKNEYALQLALTNQSSLKFAWASSSLKGDFYFNIKRSAKKNDVTSITGYTHFHLGNEAGAKPVTINTGVVNRIPINTKKEDVATAQKTKHTYVLVQSRSYGGISIKEILQMITPKVVQIPSFLDNIKIQDFGIIHTKPQNKKSTLLIKLDADFKISDATSIDLHLKVVYHDGDFQFITQLEAKNGLSLGLLIKKFGYKNPPKFFDSIVISQIAVSRSQEDVEVKESGKTVKKTITTTAFDCKTKDGTELYIVKLKDVVANNNDPTKPKKKTKDNKSLVFAKINIGGVLHLSRLPIIGKAISAVGDITISDLSMIFASEKLKKNDLKKGTKAYSLRVNNPHVTHDVDYKLSVSGDIKIAGEKIIDLNAKLLDFKEDAPQVRKPHMSASKQGVSKGKKGSLPIEAALHKVHWMNLNKQVGPAHIGKLGIQLIENKEVQPDDAQNKGNDIAFYVNLGLALGGLNIELLDLIMRFSINSLASQKIDPSFQLSGMSISYANSSIALAGAFYSQHNTPNIGDYEYVRNYTGYLMFRAKMISMQLLGQYAKLRSTKTHRTFNSMFLFGVLGGNLGGTSAYSLKAIAVGGGYNSNLRLPQPQEVGSFPFIKMLVNKEAAGSVSVIMDSLLHVDRPWLISKEANNWFAFGLKVNVYKLIDASVLLVGILKEYFELALLGVATAVFPKDAKKMGVRVFAKIELFLRASLKPHEGVLAIDILISHNSFIIDKACHITGSIAYYTWFGNHQNSGDFVLSIGGYHPDFAVPKHYPKLERLGLKWQVFTGFHIDGSLYFAMTPRELMAGYTLNAIYHNGSLKAYFSTSVDVLVQYNPFHYDAKATAALGASYRFGYSKYIPGLGEIGFHKTLSLELSADIHIWGPPTGLILKFHIWKFSFSIEYGEQLKSLKIQTLYVNKSEGAKTVDFISMLGEPKDLVTLKATDGLVESNKKQEGSDPWIFRNDSLEIAIESQIPITAFYLNDNLEKEYQPFEINKLERGQGIKWLVKTELLYEGEIANNFVITPVTENLPTALWLKESTDITSQLTESFIRSYALEPKKSIPSKKIVHMEKHPEHNIIDALNLNCPF